MQDVPLGTGISAAMVEGNGGAAGHKACPKC